MQAPLEVEVVPDVPLSQATPRSVRAEFDELLRSGRRLTPVGEAKADPAILLRGRRAPRFRLRFLGATYYLSHFANDDLNFFIAYVALDGKKRIWPRIFYKDSSLVWRVGSHVVRTDDENWIGKGDVMWQRQRDGEYLVSLEETTNLPFEIQAALDDATRAGAKPRADRQAVQLVLRAGSTNRIRPFADFTKPRAEAAARYRLNGNRLVVRLDREGDPSSVVYAKGFEPDFAPMKGKRGGHLGCSHSSSRLYGGRIEKHRVLSKNRLVQYQFVASPTHVWMNPPQAMTTELTPFGIRSIHVRAVDEAFIPGYEFHYLDATVDPPELHSQIPEGFAGEPSDVDPDRADASPWNDQLTMIKAFRKRVLGRHVLEGSKP